MMLGGLITPMTESQMEDSMEAGFRVEGLGGLGFTGLWIWALGWVFM